MAGLFDPSMFMPNDPRAGLFARLSGLAGFQPTPQSMLPGQPGTDAMASGIIPPQGPPPGQPQAPMSPMPQGAPQGNGFMDALTGFLGNHSNALMGLGAGIASGGLQRGVGGMAQGGQMDYQRNLQQSTLAATYQSLLQSGLPEGVARAAALNPEVLKAVAPSLYARSTLTDFGTDPLTGQKNMQWTNPLNQSVTPAVPAGGSTPTTTQLFDQIAQARQQGAAMPDLLKLLPNSLQEGVSAMIEGRALPPNLSMRGAARDMTVRLAHEVDPTFDETMIPQRVAFAHGMAQTTPNSNGGQKILLNTALQHAGELSDQLVNLHNTNGILTGVPGSGPMANLYNNIANSSSNMGNTTNAVGDISQKLSGEVGKLYSGSSGGGEAERQATAGRFSTGNTPNQSVGGLTATKNLILDKLNALQNQRDQVYGSHGERIYPLVDTQTKAAIDKIDANIAKLSGSAPSTGATSAAAPTSGIVHWERGPDGKPRMVAQ